MKGRKIRKYSEIFRAHCKPIALKLKLFTTFFYFIFRFFLEDDVKLEKIRQDYSSGELLSGFLKKELIDILTPLVLQHQERRKAVIDDVIREFVKPRPLQF